MLRWSQDRACCIYTMDNLVGFSVLCYIAPDRSNILHTSSKISRTLEKNFQFGHSWKNWMSSFCISETLAVPKKTSGSRIICWDICGSKPYKSSEWSKTFGTLYFEAKENIIECQETLMVVLLGVPVISHCSCQSLLINRKELKSIYACNLVSSMTKLI